MAKKSFIEDEELKLLAESIITEKKIDYMANVKVKFLLVDPYLSKTCVGKTVRVNSETEFLSGFEYLIEVSKKVWDSVDAITRKIMIEHLLKHILITTDAESGETKMGIARHDVSNFFSIIKEHGIEWYDGFRATVSAINNVDLKDKDRISL